MTEYSCDVIRDLLPLYADGSASENTKAAVRRHLLGCAECRKFYSHQNRELHSGRAGEGGGKYHYLDVVKKIRRKTVIPRNSPVVASIRAAPARCPDVNPSGKALRNHLSITAMMMHAGMNDSSDSAYIQ